MHDYYYYYYAVFNAPYVCQSMTKSQAPGASDTYEATVPLNTVLTSQ